MLWDLIFSAFALAFGACIGSFLNVVIYRLPRGISINTPSRSFCPKCRASIAWYHNIPVLSWLWLRARCASCRCSIPARYPLVEALTAILYLGLWATFGWPLAVVYSVVGAILIAIAFIDAENGIIPDILTAALGIIGLSLGFLGHGPSASPGAALFGAAIWGGFFLATIILGRRFFGQHSMNVIDTKVSWRPDESSAVLTIGQKDLRWENLFTTEDDRIQIAGSQITIAGKEGEVSFHQGPLRFSWDRVRVGAWEWNLEDVSSISARADRITLSREVMGMGDAKLAAALGALLGVIGGGAAIFIACLLQALLCGILRSKKLPFGPAIAAAILVVLIASSPTIVGLWLRSVG